MKNLNLLKCLFVLACAGLTVVACEKREEKKEIKKEVITEKHVETTIPAAPAGPTATTEPAKTIEIQTTTETKQ